MERLKKRGPGRLARTLQTQSRWEDIPSDVLGSYTGSPMDGHRPVQDADDL